MRESDKNISNTETVEYRPTIVNFWGGLFFFSFGIAIGCAQFLPDFHGGPIPLGARLFFIVNTLGWVGFAMRFILPVALFRVVVNPDGLRWRNMWGRWHAASWSAVSDYYLSSSYSVDDSRERLVPVVETASGVVRLGHNIKSEDLDALRQIVRERATTARVSDWEPLGVRRVDPWPQTFRYWEPGRQKRFLRWLAITGLVYAMVASGFVLLALWIARIPYVSGLPLIYGILAVGYAALLAVSVPHVVAYYNDWKRRAESITTTPETVRYENSATGEQREVAWSEVSDYFLRPSSSSSLYNRYMITLPGADEVQISWDGTLMHSKQLLAVVQKYAPTPANGRGNGDAWRDKSIHEKTGGSDPSTWKGGAVGMGGRVFAYRNDSSLYLLSLMTVIAGFIIILSISMPTAPDNKAEVTTRIFAVIIGLVFGLPASWGWLGIIANSRVETDDVGITQYTPFGKKYLPWFAVDDYGGGIKSNSSSRYVYYLHVTGRNGVRMAIWDTCKGFKELQDEIERCAPPPKMGWKKTP